MQLMIKQLLIVLSLVTSACSEAEKNFQSEISSGRCDDALSRLPEKDPMIKLTNQTKQAAGTVASYAFVGASYGVQILWDITGGTVGMIALCGPAIAATAMAGANGGSLHGINSQLRCLPGDFGVFLAPPLGKQALQKTKPLRCPDLKTFSQSLRSVASCYEGLGDKESLNKALTTLQSVKDSKEFYSCMPNSEKKSLDEQTVAVKAKLDGL